MFKIDPGQQKRQKVEKEQEEAEGKE